MVISISGEAHVMRVCSAIVAAALLVFLASPANGQTAPDSMVKQAFPKGQKAKPHKPVSTKALEREIAREWQLVRNPQNGQRSVTGKPEEALPSPNDHYKTLAVLELALLGRFNKALKADGAKLRGMQSELAKLQKTLRERKPIPQPPSNAVNRPSTTGSGPSLTELLIGGAGLAGLAGVLGLGLGWGMARLPRFAKPFMPAPHFKASVEPLADAPYWKIASTDGEDASKSMRSLGLRCRLELGELEAPSSVPVVKEERDERA